MKKRFGAELGGLGKSDDEEDDDDDDDVDYDDDDDDEDEDEDGQTFFIDSPRTLQKMKEKEEEIKREKELLKQREQQKKTDKKDEEEDDEEDNDADEDDDDEDDDGVDVLEFFKGSSLTRVQSFTPGRNSSSRSCTPSPTPSYSSLAPKGSTPFLIFEEEVFFFSILDDQEIFKRFKDTQKKESVSAILSSQLTKDNLQENPADSSLLFRIVAQNLCDKPNIAEESGALTPTGDVSDEMLTKLKKLREGIWEREGDREEKGKGGADEGSETTEEEEEALTLSAKDLHRDLQLKMKVMKEIVETEIIYLKDLRLIESIFKTPLQTSKIITPAEISAIFSNVVSIIGIHDELSHKLNDVVVALKEVMPEEESLLEKKKMRSLVREKARIGHIFLTFAAFLKMYSNYCNNQDKARDTIAECKKKNSNFVAFLEKSQADPQCRGLLLNSFLIKPVQRLCKYPLFLRELIKYTNDDKEELRALQSAYDEIDDSVQAINESKKQAESLVAMVQLQKEVDKLDKLSLITPSRRLLLDTTFYEFTMLTDTVVPQSEIDTIRWVLFNDLLLRAKKKNTKHKTKTHKLESWIPLKTVSVRPINTEAHVKLEEGGVEFVHGCHLKVNNDVDYYLYHNSLAVRDEFSSKIDEISQANHGGTALNLYSRSPSFGGSAQNCSSTPTKKFSKRNLHERKLKAVSSHGIAKSTTTQRILRNSSGGVNSEKDQKQNQKKRLKAFESPSTKRGSRDNGDGTKSPASHLRLPKKEKARHKRTKSVNTTVFSGLGTVTSGASSDLELDKETKKEKREKREKRSKKEEK